MSGMLDQITDPEELVNELVQELRAEVARLRERDRQWEAAFAKLAGLALEDDGTCPIENPMLADEFIAHCMEVDGRCACARGWAGAPEPLEEKTP